MGRKVLMICTSGTSAYAAYKQGFLSISPELETIPEEEIWKVLFSSTNLREQERRTRAAELMLQPEKHENALLDPDFGSKYLFPSAELQTILRWISDMMQGKTGKTDELRIVMLPSQAPDSGITAKVTVLCLKKIAPLLKGITLDCSDGPDGIVPLNINVDTRECFLSSVSNLYAEMNKLIEGKKPDEEAIICATGGYKVISGFAIMYAQLHSIPCLYSFENSPAAYEVMSMPLGFAYASMDEEINMLKAVSMDTEVDRESLPQWLRDSEKMAGTLLKSYAMAREKPYGTGEEMFRRLRQCKDGNSWADYLQELLVSKWGELWLGDQIPETVEHSRRHSKRLLELAANLFRSAGDKMEAIGFTKEDPRMFALLIASIYLHDIGHTALSYPVAVKQEDIQNENLFPLGLFPSAVRELHHLLTAEVLSSDPERYFLISEHREKGEFLLKYVPLIAAYNRGYTVLKKDRKAALDNNNRILKAGNLILGEDKFAETLQPQEIKGEDGELPVRKLLNITAILRVLDGCDVQTDRVVSQHYLNYRNQRSEDEARLIQAEMMSCIRQLPSSLQEKIRAISRSGITEKELKNCCKGIYSDVFDALKTLREQYGTWRNVQGYALSQFMALSLANKLAFKLEQHLHFQKHQSIAFVLPVMDTEKNRIQIRLFPNSCDMETISDIISDIDGEYEKVKDVLEDFPEVKAELAE